MSKDRLQAIRGMNDVLPPESAVWSHLEQSARKVLHAAGFREARTPIVEVTALFARGVGETTDVVEKEMYTFADRDGTSLSLRPEGTASCVRAYVEHAVHKAEPITRWYYAGPMYRHERPQKGRYRQFHQIGLEAFGSDDPMLDAEVVALLDAIVRQAGIERYELRLSSVGCNEADCRPAYRARLIALLEARKGELCEDCQRRVERNPLRVFDCKQPGCIQVAKTLPRPLEGICARCLQHFDGVRRYLDAATIGYLVDSSIVRGLDYYTRTAFEIHGTGPELGSQNALGGGGRYDGLVEALGGPAVTGVGFAVGVERLVMALGPGAAERLAPRADLFIVATADVPGARERAFSLAVTLRGQGLTVELDPRGGSFKSQMKRAGNVGARFVAILGAEELAAGNAALKNLETGTQEQVALDAIAAKLQSP